MENNMQGKKSNARVAWDEFISKFNLGNESPGLAPALSPLPANQIACCPAEPEEPVWETAGNDREGPPDEVAVAPPRTTVIGENVKIDGNCTLQGDIEVYGVINGDISAGGKISVFGKITGNLTGANIYLNAAEVTGSLITEGTVELDSLSVLADGKVLAKNIVSNGNTHCDMEISGIARFQPAARVTGHIRTARINIDEGAIIKGTIISE